MKAIIYLLAGLVLMSCEKIIEVNLNDSAPVTVAEAAIAYGDSTHAVVLTKTANYFGVSSVTPVLGATVTMTGPAGDVHTFNYDGTGAYVNADYLQSGDGLYTLQIEHEGQTSIAKSQLTTQVGIDSISIKTLGFGTRTFEYVQIHLTDPIDEANFYHLITYRNDTLLDAFRNISDENFTVNNQVINLRGFQVKSGDHIKVILRNIDEAMFNYLGELRAVVNSRFIGSPSPSNPSPYFESGNIKLGYFNIYHESVVDYTLP